MAYIYKSAELQRLEEIEPECNSIDVNMFRDFQKGTVVAWILQNSKTLTSHVISKLLDVYSELPRSESLPAHVREYISKEEQSFAISEIQYSTPRLRRPLPAVAFFATNYDNLSCHEILFRVSLPTVMSKKAEQFIRLMGMLPAHKRNHICTMLKWGQELTHNVQYVLKLRLMELSSELGVEFSELISSGKFSTFNRAIINDFIQGKNTPWQSATSSKYSNSPDLLVESPLFIMVYMVCICNAVAADRLLLQDYSRFAVFSSGETLNEEQQRMLSLFLCAGVVSQDMAIQQVVMELTDHGSDSSVLAP